MGEHGKVDTRATPGTCWSASLLDVLQELRNAVRSWLCGSKPTAACEDFMHPAGPVMIKNLQISKEGLGCGTRRAELYPPESLANIHLFSSSQLPVKHGQALKWVSRPTGDLVQAKAGNGTTVSQLFASQAGHYSHLIASDKWDMRTPWCFQFDISFYLSKQLLQFYKWMAIHYRFGGIIIHANMSQNPGLFFFFPTFLLHSDCKFPILPMRFPPPHQPKIN